MNNLAATLFAEGDRAAARSLLESVLEVHQRALGEEHPHTLKSLGNLAATLWRLGDLAGARQLEERALQTRQRTLGDAHPDTLLAMHNLAYTLRDLGDRDGARQLAEQALAGRRHALGDHHPDTQSTAALAAGLGSETPVPAPGGDPASSSDGRIRQSIGTSLLTFLRRLLG
ncbi:MAG: tetratricopeptide repeat protein [Proteobacteria bacterium]|nr:tetratricopeptide repeat protein [Pseudomonadota bacterium]